MSVQVRVLHWMRSSQVTFWQQVNQKNTSGFQKFLYFGIANNGLWTWISLQIENYGQIWVKITKLLTLCYPCTRVHLSVQWIFIEWQQQPARQRIWQWRRWTKIRASVLLLPQPQALPLSPFSFRKRNCYPSSAFPFSVRLFLCNFTFSGLVQGRSSSLLCKPRVLGTYLYCTCNTVWSILSPSDFPKWNVSTW